MNLDAINKLLVKYSIEFVVVVLGIGLSFYVDDLRQHEYDVELKNRSLLRIRANIHSDIQDAEWNIYLHKSVIRSCNTLVSKHAHYFDHARDSLAGLLRYQSIVNSQFLDLRRGHEPCHRTGHVAFSLWRSFDCTRTHSPFGRPTGQTLQRPEGQKPGRKGSGQHPSDSCARVFWRRGRFSFGALRSNERMVQPL